MDATSLRKISDWIIDGARSAATPSQMMAECCERLVQAGLPLWRVGVFVRTLHPEIIGWSFIWKPGEEVHVGTVDFNFRATPEFTFSPLAVVFRDERDESTRRGVSQHTGEPRRVQWPSQRAREVRAAGELIGGHCFERRQPGRTLPQLPRFGMSVAQEYF